MDEWNESLGVAGAGVAVVLAGVFAQRPGRRVRLGEVGLVPWNALMLLGAIAALFAAARLLDLARPR